MAKTTFRRMLKVSGKELWISWGFIFAGLTFVVGRQRAVNHDRTVIERPGCCSVLFWPKLAPQTHQRNEGNQSGHDVDEVAYTPLVRDHDALW